MSAFMASFEVNSRVEPGFAGPANRLFLREPGEPAPAKLRMRAGHLVLAGAAFPVGVEPGERRRGGRRRGRPRSGRDRASDRRASRATTPRTRASMVSSPGMSLCGRVVELEELTLAVPQRRGAGRLVRRAAAARCAAPRSRRRAPSTALARPSSKPRRRAKARPSSEASIVNDVKRRAPSDRACVSASS